MIQLSIQGGALHTSVQSPEYVFFLIFFFFTPMAYHFSAGLRNQKIPMHQYPACIWLKVQYVMRRTAVMMIAGVLSGSRTFLSELKLRLQLVLPTTDTL